jgi:hypothetical protein
MTMKDYIEKLHAYFQSTDPNQAKIESILGFLYEAYDEHTGMDNEQIKKDFHELYLAMNGEGHQKGDYS